MLYQLPKDKKLADLANAIDENGSQLDDDTLYQYLYVLIRWISLKSKVFAGDSDHPEFDDFCVYLTEILFGYYKPYMESQKSLTKIKRIVPYLKSTIINYKQNFVSRYLRKGLTWVGADNLEQYYNPAVQLHAMQGQIEGGIQKIEFKILLQQIPRMIKEIVDQTPYQGIEKHNIYLSCLLTIINFLILPDFLQSRLDKYDGPNVIFESTRRHSYMDLYAFTADVYRLNRIDNVLLFGLDKSMRDYIDILAKYIMSDLTDHLSRIVAEDYQSLFVMYTTQKNELESAMYDNENNNYGDQSD